MNSALYSASDYIKPIRTPIADRLAELRKLTGKSFHGLLLSGGASIAHFRLRGRFEELFSQDYLCSNLTITGKHFDSLFFAEGVIREAEELAACLSYNLTGKIRLQDMATYFTSPSF